jgi:hypothetical protein
MLESAAVQERERSSFLDQFLIDPARIAAGEKPRWLLVKMRDEETDSLRNPAEIETKSALSGRTMKQIKEEAEESQTALLK